MTLVEIQVIYNDRSNFASGIRGVYETSVSTGLFFSFGAMQSQFGRRRVIMSESKRIAVICASNQNRSMETHFLFKERGVPNVFSFGTGSQVKLPGPTRNQPNVYDFGSSYQEIYNDLSSKDAMLYVHYIAFTFCLPS